MQLTVVFQCIGQQPPKTDLLASQRHANSLPTLQLPIQAIEASNKGVWIAAQLMLSLNSGPSQHCCWSIHSWDSTEPRIPNPFPLKCPFSCTGNWNPNETELLLVESNNSSCCSQGHQAHHKQFTAHLLTLQLWPGRPQLCSCLLEHSVTKWILQSPDCP